jgi:hypothetical protein
VCLPACLPAGLQIASILQLVTGIFEAPTALLGLMQDAKAFVKDAAGR